jgi:hypothetical protein
MPAPTGTMPMSPCCAAWRRLLRAAAVLVAAVMPLLAGCQTGIDVSALNRCGYAVEARADVVTDTSVNWSKIEPDERANIVTTGENTTELYVWVRSSKDATPVEFVVDVADLPTPPEGVDDDVEIVLDGDRCPSPAG